ncbi:FkbM family methyltransferase [Flexibacterium corallicola]|uniref:FkbM family methyltransferase n=1 Tax=Flexibacterium corallicola TaxID=3037259 RepID=UPI00286F0F58|nr:FkbM family methyltransferase [Pseudovibrio sp. M1P-2-3]
MIIEKERTYIDINLKYEGRKAIISERDPKDRIFKTIAQSKQFYERILLNYLYHLAMPDWVFIDIGAHIGNHSVFFGSILGLQGYSFEANTETYQTLQHNIRQNGLEGSVAYFNRAIGHKQGRGSLIKSTKAHNSGMCRFQNTSTGDIEMTTIDALHLPKLDLLKIDVEGYELNCLLGAKSTLIRTKPLIVIEIIETENFLEIKDWLRPYGYQPMRRYNSTPTYIFSTQPRSFYEYS